MRGLATQRGIADHSPAEARKSLVEQLLEGGTPIKLWHFACHGNFDQQAPNNSPLILQNRYFLRPNDLVGRAQTRLRTDRPLVFLNACRVGQGGLALTGLGGAGRQRWLVIVGSVHSLRRSGRYTTALPAISPKRSTLPAGNRA